MESNVQYDRWGRMKYHPDYHENHRKPWDKEDDMYLCAMHGSMKIGDIALALGRTYRSAAQRLETLKRKRLYKRYRTIMSRM
ncbi:MAG: DNA-entry nuclease [Firmicutes bacterium]|nr:DNA-entry nuclease [Bacillota bacterium]